MPTWNAASGTWNTASNWTGNVIANGIASSAIFTFFGNANGTFDVGILESSTIVVGSISYTASGTAGFRIIGQDAGISGSALLVFNNNRSNAHLDINILPSTTLSSITSGPGNLVVELVSNLEVNVVNAGTEFMIFAPVTGAGSLIKMGEGTLKLFGSPNSFTGGIQITGGLLEIERDSRLGSGAVTISNGAVFLASDENLGIVDQAIGTVLDAQNIAGAAQLITHSGSQVTMTGALSHVSRGFFLFGMGANTGTIVASFSSITNNLTSSGYSVSGGTLKIGNSVSASDLLRVNGQGWTAIETGATLDTNGFNVVINNLDMNGGTIRSSNGPLNIYIRDVLLSARTHVGTIEGTTGQDFYTAAVEVNYGLENLTFANWNDAVDRITINGGDNANSLRGSTHADTINGFGGDDFILGGGGIDVLAGGVGNDTISVSENGNGSSVSGGFDFDTLQIGGGAVTLNSVSGFERIVLSSNTLYLTGSQIATGLALNTVVTGFIDSFFVVHMTAGVDALTKLFDFTNFSGTATYNGTGSADLIKVGNARNFINAGNGLDRVQGGSLVDSVNGGNDADKIAGNGGADVLTGGAGADIFKYRAVGDSGTTLATADLITDFIIGTDKLNFVKIDANAGLAGDQAFSFNGTGAFVANGLGQIRYATSGTDLRVEVDVDGNGSADMWVILSNLAGQTLSAADFVL